MGNELVVLQDLIFEIRDVLITARSNVAHQVNRGWAEN